MFDGLLVEAVDISNKAEEFLRFMGIDIVVNSVGADRSYKFTRYKNSDRKEIVVPKNDDPKSRRYSLMLWHEIAHLLDDARFMGGGKSNYSYSGVKVTTGRHSTKNSMVLHNNEQYINDGVDSVYGMDNFRMDYTGEGKLYKFYSVNDIMKSDIKESEKARLSDVYNRGVQKYNNYRSQDIELFANGFALYMDNPSKMEEESPELFNAMNEVVETDDMIGAFNQKKEQEIDKSSIGFDENAPMGERFTGLGEDEPDKADVVTGVDSLEYSPESGFTWEVGPRKGVRRKSDKGYIYRKAVYEKYPDGRMIPQEGDEVYAARGGMFGAPVYFYGIVEKGRVRITDMGGMLTDKGQVGKKVALTPQWTVKSDPQPKIKEQERIDKKKKEENDWMESQRKFEEDNKKRLLESGDKPVSFGELKEGDMVVDYGSGDVVFGQVVKNKYGDLEFQFLDGQGSMALGDNYKFLALPNGEHLKELIIETQKKIEQIKGETINKIKELKGRELDTESEEYMLKDLNKNSDLLRSELQKHLDTSTEKTEKQDSMTYEQFKDEYTKLFNRSMSYSPKEVGGAIYAEKMADLAEKYPDYAERIDSEADGIQNENEPVYQQGRKYKGKPAEFYIDEKGNKVYKKHAFTQEELFDVYKTC